MDSRANYPPPIELNVTAKLSYRRVTVNRQEVEAMGIEEFHTCPSRRGLGEAAIRVLEALAREANRKWIVGFTDKPTLEFYRKVGWHVASNQIKSFDGTMKWPVYWCDTKRQDGVQLPTYDGFIVEPCGKDW